MTALFDPTPVSPNPIVIETLLRADTAVSHHDPAVQDDSNRNLFNRQKILVNLPAGASADDDAIRRFVASHPIPGDVAEVYETLTFPEFVATALLRLWLSCYPYGTGLFEGVEGYQRLEDRLRQSAVRSGSLLSLWSRLSEAMLVPIHAGETDKPLLAFGRLPGGTQQSALRACVSEARNAVSLARLWREREKHQNENYANKSGGGIAEPSRVPEFAPCPNEPTGAVVIDVPMISTNTIRHTAVRAPGWKHLSGLLGLPEMDPGAGRLPGGVEALFVNGGNIAAGAKQPTNPHGLAAAIRRTFPLLDLLGGVTDSFDLGESRLKVSSWIVCREYREALAGTIAEDMPEASVSVFDLMDDVTQTRQATEAGIGQMIMSFEALAARAVLYCRYTLMPFTGQLTMGALVSALSFAPYVGGGSARGYGNMHEVGRSEPDDSADARSAYESYITSNAADLRAALMDGTLGSGSVVCR